tara:strand:+ start:99 stop:530 length:432 start_codon:yes stop_codon:yes gene_type:complete
MTPNENEVTLLLIEDDDVDAMSVARAFKKMGLSNEIIRAHDGIEGLELLRSGAVPSPYIILLDLQLPRLNGLEFLHEIRQDRQLDQSIVFVLTTSKSDEDITASYKKNIAGYFVKDNVGEGFIELITLLKGYWKMILFPEKND